MTVTDAVIKHSNISVIVVTEGEERENGAEK
jgi:hypothetical protein